MKKIVVSIWLVVFQVLFLFTGCGITGKTVGTTSSEITGVVPQSRNLAQRESESIYLKVNTQNKGLSSLYKNNFKVGVALPQNLVKKSSGMTDFIMQNFNSITCENEMKPYAILDQAACRANLRKTYRNPAVHFDSCKDAITFARENGIQIRLHTLVWYSQTPDWFFTEDYTDGGRLASREVMLARMENYIKNVLTYFNQNYPGLIYAVDVCNEAFDVGKGDKNGIRRVENKWYDTVGDDYYYQAFVFARKYASRDMKLFYNDYGCMFKTDLILRHLQRAKREGLIDGIGMQAHLSIADDIHNKFIGSVKRFCEAGYEIQITELDIGMKQKTDYNLARQGSKYKVLFRDLKALKERGYNITSVTVWGLNDGHTWRKGEYPLLFDEWNRPKPAYYGAMLSEHIPAVE